MSDTGVQSSYSFYPKTAFAGMLADIGQKRVLSFLNPNVALYIGCLAVRDTNDGEAKHPTSAAEVTTLAKKLGLVLSAQDLESSVGDGLGPHYPVNSCPNILAEGIGWVAPEDTPTNQSPVYVRYANGIADNTKTQKGAFRSTPDGTAQVDTLTPTANNNDGYSVEILDDAGNLVCAGSYESDGTATAAEIVTGLKAALGAPAYVAFTGTNTLIITAATAGRGFTTNIGANLTKVATTANAQSAALLPGARWMTGKNSDGFAQLKIG